MGARARQLENEQTRLFAPRPFVRSDAGVMTGEENSHEPRARVVVMNGKKKVDGAAEQEAVRAVARAMLDAFTSIAPQTAEPRASGFAAALVGHLEAGARGDFASASMMVAALFSISIGRRWQSDARAVA